MHHGLAATLILAIDIGEAKILPGIANAKRIGRPK
jgi:hypothetical protein